ncbi:MAG: GNAT family N-acetyltransferase [Litorivicinus sp.]
MNEIWELSDGQRLRARTPDASDVAALRNFFDGLSPASRRQRFMGGISRVSDAFVAGLLRLDAEHDAALVLENHERIVASARFDSDADHAGCEFALAVDDTLAGHGLGERLMRWLITTATDRGYRSIHGEVLSDNARMLRLMERLGFSHHLEAEDRRVTWVSKALPAL